MRENIASIQFLRFVAATLVVFFHSTRAMNQYFSGSVSSPLSRVADFGASGVHIFFVISGFIMIYTSFHNKGEAFSGSKFMMKRIIRVYPIYFVYSAFYLYFYYFFTIGKNLSLGRLFGALLLLPGYSPLIIGPGWTLSYEIYFYLCFSIAMMLGLIRGVWALTIFFLFMIMLRFVLDTSQETIHVITNTLLVEFLFGAWIGYAIVSSVRISNAIANAMLVLAFGGFVGGAIYGYIGVPFVLMWGVPSALLVAGLIFKERNGRIPFLIKHYSSLGDSSYSLYLLHIVLIDAAILFAMSVDSSIEAHVRASGTFGMVLICLVMTSYCVAVAYVSYELIERRLVSRLQDLYRRKGAPAPAIST